MIWQGFVLHSAVVYAIASWFSAYSVGDVQIFVIVLPEIALSFSRSLHLNKCFTVYSYDALSRHLIV